MDLFQIETFLAVAREGSFSRAAQKLFRTQPAISQTIRKLEEDLGESLFDRSSREGMLTDAGRVLQDYAERLLNVRTEALTAVKELRALHRGNLCIAANEFTCLYLLPLLQEFRRVYPMIKVTIQRTLASRVSTELANHTTELGIISFRPEDSTLRSIVVYRDELALIVPPGHPLATEKEVAIKDLASETFIAHNVPSPYRARVLETFRKKRVPLHMGVELPSIEAIKKFVACGNGVALLPVVCVEAEVARGDLVHVTVPELRFERKVRIIYRANSNLSHAATAFFKVAENLSRQRKGRYLFQSER